MKEKNRWCTICDPVTLTIVAAGATAASGGYSAYNTYKQGAAQNKYYQAQANQSRQEGERAVALADQQSTFVQDSAKIQGKQLAENQAEYNASTRAQMAAQGVTGVTAEDIVNNNLSKEKMDELALRYNADAKSWEINTKGQYDNWAARTQALNLDYAGKSAKYAGKVGAATTLLATASSVLSTAAGAKTGTKSAKK